MANTFQTTLGVWKQCFPRDGKTDSIVFGEVMVGALGCPPGRSNGAEVTVAFKEHTTLKALPCHELTVG